jgi:hypothetical protein
LIGTLFFFVKILVALVRDIFAGLVSLVALVRGLLVGLVADLARLLFVLNRAATMLALYYLQECVLTASQ